MQIGYPEKVFLLRFYSSFNVSIWTCLSKRFFSPPDSKLGPADRLPRESFSFRLDLSFKVSIWICLNISYDRLFHKITTEIDSASIWRWFTVPSLHVRIHISVHCKGWNEQLVSGELCGSFWWETLQKARYDRILYMPTARQANKFARQYIEWASFNLYSQWFILSTLLHLPGSIWGSIQLLAPKDAVKSIFSIWFRGMFWKITQ
jgi:hypothetical protein